MKGTPSHHHDNSISEAQQRHLQQQLQAQQEYLAK
jgi:hypothetical protein